MMEKFPVDLLLTDEFTAFATQISSLHAEKTRLKNDFKKLYEKCQLDIAAIDKKAMDASSAFEKWQADFATKSVTTEKKTVDKK